MSETKNNLELRSKVNFLGYEISGSIDHGECFYDSESLKKFCDNLDEMKKLAKEYYESNRKEMDED